jgi:hypothetical protein
VLEVPPAVLLLLLLLGKEVTLQLVVMLLVAE